MSKNTSTAGFPEYLPEFRSIEQQILDSLRHSFELWGFASIETRAVEPMTVLAGKGEIDKEVYTVHRLHADPDEAPARNDGLGLHYDLTVPFARYVVENVGKLDFPFRRYQIQKVWRGERPQRGRFREFLQADVDIVADGELPASADAEVTQVMVSALSALPLPGFTLQMNNRRLIEGFYRGVGANDPMLVMRIIDKIDKVPAEVTRTALQSQAGLNPDQIERCLALTAISTADPSELQHKVHDLEVQHPMLEQGLNELAQVLNATRGVISDRVQVVADLRIARGLDYYTGTVFEARMHGWESLGSICSGGRYESLATVKGRALPGVGISFGVTRTLATLFADGVLTASRKVPTCVLVAVIDEVNRPRSMAAAAALRQRGIACEVYAASDKYGKQIKYAARRGIPYVWFPATAGVATVGEVKDIRSGSQSDADASEWMPADADRVPQIEVHQPR